MEDVFLIRSPDDVLLYLQSPAAQGILEGDEHAVRIMELFEYGIAVDQANIGAIYLELGDFQQALRYLGQALSYLEAWCQVQEAEEVRHLMQTAESQLA